MREKQRFYFFLDSSFDPTKRAEADLFHTYQDAYDAAKTYIMECCSTDETVALYTVEVVHAEYHKLGIIQTPCPTNAETT